MQTATNQSKLLRDTLLREPELARVTVDGFMFTITDPLKWVALRNRLNNREIPPKSVKLFWSWRPQTFVEVESECPRLDMTVQEHPGGFGFTLVVPSSMVKVVVEGNHLRPMVEQNTMCFRVPFREAMPPSVMAELRRSF